MQGLQLWFARRINRVVLRRTATVAGVLLALFGLFVWYFERALLPVLRELAPQEATRLLQGALDETCAQVFAETRELLHPICDESGAVLFIQCDSARLNRLRAALSERLDERLCEKDYARVRVPVGSLTGSALLFGRGPSASVRLLPSSAAVVNFEQTFEEGGINQTLFTLSAKAELQTVLLMPGERVEKTVVITCPLVQTLLNGAVPQVYIET